MTKRISTSVVGLLILCGAASADAQDSRPDLKYGLCIHYGMPTFVKSGERDVLPDEQAWKQNGKALPAERFAPPATLDVRAWARAAKDAGMTFAVLTAKHESGFCLWDAKDYDYSISKSPYKGDIIRDFIEACKADGIAPGVHYSIPDAYNEGEARGKGAVSVPYFKVIQKHLAELHTLYPQLRVQIVDGAERLSSGQQEQLRQIVHRLNPECVIWEGGWIGSHQVLATTIWGWFWRPQYKLFPMQRIEALLDQAKANNKTFLLNVGPAPDGVIPADQLASLKAVMEVMTRQSSANKEAISVGQQLIDLKKAKDAGAITDTEYQAQKAKLLGN